MYFTIKGKLILILFISVISCSCSKHLGKVSITYLDKETKEPIAGIKIDIYKSNDNGHEVIKTLTTDNNGVCEIAGIDLPSSKWNVYSLNETDFSDTTSIEYQYLGQSADISYPYNQSVTCFAPPSGVIGFLTFGNFWKTKNYDTLLINSSLGLDTLIRNIDSVGHTFYAKPVEKIHFDFFSKKDGVTTQVYSLDKNPFFIPDVSMYTYQDYIFLQF